MNQIQQVNILKGIIPELPLAIIIEGVEATLEQYKNCPCENCAGSLKTQMLAMELKLLHTHNKANYNAVIEDSIEAQTMHTEMSDIVDLANGTASAN
jgi:hypothetical protein